MKKGPYRQPGGGRKVADPNMEKHLIEWYFDLIGDGQMITSKQFKEKARELTSLSQFKASKGWLEKLKKKYNLRFVRPKKMNNDKIYFDRV